MEFAALAASAAAPVVRSSVRGLLLVLVLTSRLLLAFVANTGRRPTGRNGNDTRQGIQAIPVLAPENQFSALSHATDDAFSVSVVSMNILAPYYQHLGLVRGNDTATAHEAIQNDRLSRIPLAVKRAAISRPDILLLQEVEGGDQPNLLVEKSLLDLGYTGYKWSSLYPDQDEPSEDCVGLAVAFDSNRFQCIRHVAFRRGQVVKLYDEKSNRAFVLANLHLNAKPSAIEPRLRSIASCMGHIKTVLAGEPATIILGGDLNCEDPSVTTRLITAGSVPFGTIRDRNYKTKITKAVAKNLRHSFRFTSVYSGAKEAAPVTVCLKGRGPGIMDHLFLCTNSSTSVQTTSSPSSRRQGSTAMSSLAGSKRRSRRQRALYTPSAAVDHGTQDEKPLSIMAVLATVDNDESYQTILEGLPNVGAGFPSDHLPIGVLLSLELAETEIDIEQTESGTSGTFVGVAKGHSSLSGAAVKRRISFQLSSVVRQRHNQVVQKIADWLPPGSKRDASLAQLGLSQLKRKSRAPDLCCVIGNTLFVIEVTVVAAKNLDSAVIEKLRKYEDVAPALRTSSYVVEQGLIVSDTLVVAFDEEGRAFPSARVGLNTLMNAMSEQSVKGNGATVEGLLASIEQLILQSARALASS
jgi:endonuclease/exonuclease/phosphatase family metal-dependent hydrolase